MRHASVTASENDGRERERERERESIKGLGHAIVGEKPYLGERVYGTKTDHRIRSEWPRHTVCKPGVAHFRDLQA